MENQKQVCDIRAGKRMTIAQSNEHLRVGDKSAWNANRAGNLDTTRTHLNFEIGKGGVVKEVDQKTSIAKRIKTIFNERGIADPNAGLSDEDLKKAKVGVRTHANIILQGSRETMRKLAFGDQEVNYDHGADNSHITRNENIEKWAVDMYNFIAKKYCEENIAAFVVHLDETNPHIHCTLLPITKSGRLSWVDFFDAKKKYDYSKHLEKLHDELAEVNKKWGLERGESVAVTGAQHKSYLQWLKDQEKENKEIIEKQATTISEQKQQLYTINGVLKLAEKRHKGLTTMIDNLKDKRELLEADITSLEEMQQQGKITNKELEEKRGKLNAQIADIDAKILDKRQKLDTANEQLLDLMKKKRQIQNEFDELKRNLNRERPALEDRVMRDMSAIGWVEAAREMKQFVENVGSYSRTLPPEERRAFDKVTGMLFDGTIFEDLAERGNEIAAVAAALFLGYVDQATTFVQSSGGGNGPGTGWGRDKDEDDDSFKRRCFHTARAMMKPAGRKLKR